MLEHYISLLTKAVFVENILLAYFLVMCYLLSLYRSTLGNSASWSQLS